VTQITVRREYFVGTGGEGQGRRGGGRPTCRLIAPAVTVTYRSVEGQNPLSTGPIWSRVDSHVAEFRLSQCDPS
jgi:hypothetical protein